jgi:hypothetical protein
MAAHNLVIVPHILDIKQTATQTQLTLAMIVIDADTGEAWSERWIGEATDKGDKGIAKAITIASKTYMMRLFNVQGVHDPDMKDPDADSGVVEEGKITARRVRPAPSPPVKTAAKPVRRLNGAGPNRKGRRCLPNRRLVDHDQGAVGRAGAQVQDGVRRRGSPKDQIAQWFAAHQLSAGANSPNPYADACRPEAARQTVRRCWGRDPFGGP